MGLRGYGLRVRASASLPEGLERFGFTPLDEAPGRELVFGIVGKFWRLDGGFRRVGRAEFAGFRETGYAKAAWNLYVTDSGLSTETRVVCFGDAARRKFLAYWRLVEPFSGAIRWSLLRGVRRAALR